MKIELNQIKIKDLFAKYIDNNDDGVFGYGGKLNIRPAYQRELVYDAKQQEAVINSVRSNFPLNVMYWIQNNDKFELLDGQQRTLSICKYLKGDYSINGQRFNNLTNTEKEKILNYELMVYFCEGTDKEKLDWFKVINFAGEKLTNQELLNALYPGKWLSNAKTIFSKNTCAAYNLAKDYVKGSPIRQEFLEIALKWISKDNIKEYMSKHQPDDNADELWKYFQKVIAWVKLIFPEYRSEMKGLNWGDMYNRYKDKTFNSQDLAEKLINLCRMMMFLKKLVFMNT